jgi:hypothetical protein
MSEQPAQGAYSKDEILGALGRLRGEGLDFWSDFAPERFCTPLGEAWSPADNVRHLIKSTVPVTKALGMPGLALRGLFGLADEPSRSYTEVRAAYHEVLAAGGDAGKFAPSEAPAPEDPGAWQRELVDTLRTSVADLASAAEAWNEDDLDRYRLPHPLLGKLTLREMLFFTLYHYAHHRENVVRRLAEPPDERAQ